ncbi:hypothetical protein FB563_3114 [Streptomyces puniciscabiei]|uniref:Uncharacterized protein n=1 Tax=Streptomyces puniciscabiei TaxID=164348 RepID=A0A542UGA1_9ACTN|nr:hypothetical protein [Streptomyces puniciscabiei]TQK98100.1 hypothetical protein FB563_3114 [Streptomyces puniciscabiei]
MKFSRSTVVTASALGAAALAATGVTYASAASAPEAAPAAPAPVAAPAAPAPLAGGGNGNNNGNNNNGNDNNNNGKGNEGKGNEGGGREGGRRHFEGRIEINERSYSAHPGDCITVVSGLGAKTLNIRNDSHRVVEVFRGAVCDNGAPVATVGPFSQSDGVRVRQTRGIHVHDGVVGSFRVVGHEGWGWGGRDGGHDGGWDGGWDGGDGGDGGR